MREISEDQLRKKVKSINPHWTNLHIDNDLRAMKKRKYFELFYPLVTADVQRAVVLMGPRRVGKTVILWQTIQKLIDDKADPQSILFLSLDTPILHPYSLEELLDIYKEILHVDDLTGKTVIFDEIQYLKSWDIQLKVLVDTYKNTKFIASGSAAGALKRKSQESGAGRFTDFMLPPLTFHEYLDLLELTESLIEVKEGVLGFGSEFLPKDIVELNRQFLNYLHYGGFPEAIFNEAIQKDPQRFIRSDIIDKVLLRDLPSLYGILDTQELNRLFSTLAYQTGNEVSLDGLSKHSGVAKNTIKRYIEYLEAAFLIQTVKRVDDSCKTFKRRNFFKIYLTNPSMYSAIYNPPSEEEPEILGSLVETAIFSQWMHSSEDMKKIYYARWKGGKGEVDMVYMNRRDKPSWCIEVKWSDRNIDHPERFTNLINFCKNNNLKMAKITTKSQTATAIINDVELVFKESSLHCFEVGYNLVQRLVDA